MSPIARHRWLLFLAFVLGAIAAAITIRWYFVLKKAHSSFEDYYAFRGCTELLERGANYGICRLKSGQIIRIVESDGRWFLDGDLPHKIRIGNFSF